MSTIANEGYAELAERRLHSRASISLDQDPQQFLRALQNNTAISRGALRLKNGYRVLFSEGWCEISVEGNDVKLLTECQSEEARTRAETVITGHLREVLGNDDLDVDWEREPHEGAWSQEG